MKLSKLFYVKSGILLCFMIATIVASYIVGKNFGYYLIGDIQEEHKVSENLKDSSNNTEEYSPLVNARFSFDPSEFPTDQFNGALVKKPDKEDVLEDSPTVVMSQFKSDEELNDLFDLGNKVGTDTVSEESENEEQVQSNSLYRVVLKIFDTREEAERLYNQLIKDGYDPYIIALVKDGVTKYRVQVAAFRDKDNANALAEELRKKSYTAWTLIETQ